MKASKLIEKYKEVKEQVKDKKHFTEEQLSMYMLGWLDCSLYVLREQEND